MIPRAEQVVAPSGHEHVRAVEIDIEPLGANVAPEVASRDRSLSPNRAYLTLDRRHISPSTTPSLYRPGADFQVDFVKMSDRMWFGMGFPPAAISGRDDSPTVDRLAGSR
jgi:hypothetical protein